MDSSESMEAHGRAYVQTVYLPQSLKVDFSTAKIATEFYETSWSDIFASQKIVTSAV